MIVIALACVDHSTEHDSFRSHNHLCNRYCLHPDFTDEETGGQGGSVTCPVSYSCAVPEFHTLASTGSRPLMFLLSSLCFFFQCVCPSTGSSKPHLNLSEDLLKISQTSPLLCTHSNRGPQNEDSLEAADLHSRQMTQDPQNNPMTSDSGQLLHKILDQNLA